MRQVLFLFCIWLSPAMLTCGSALCFLRQRCLSSVLLLIGSISILFGVAWSLSQNTWLSWWVKSYIGERFWSDILLYSGLVGGMLFSLGFFLHFLAQRRQPRACR